MDTKSQIVSWTDVSLGLVQGLLKEVQKRGGGDDDVRKLVTPESESLLAKFADMIVGVVLQTFKATVDRTRTLPEMISAGKYDWVNSDITADHFPAVGDGKMESELVLFHFDRRISSDDAIAKIERADYEPGDIADLLALGESQPELQRQFPIVALKSFWQNPNGYRMVPYLGGYGTERHLRLHCFGGAWGGHDRFLARRKCQKQPLGT